MVFVHVDLHSYSAGGGITISEKRSCRRRGPTSDLCARTRGEKLRVTLDTAERPQLRDVHSLPAAQEGGKLPLKAPVFCVAICKLKVQTSTRDSVTTLMACYGVAPPGGVKVVGGVGEWVEKGWVVVVLRGGVS